MFSTARLLFFGIFVIMTSIATSSCENNETKAQRMNRIISEATMASNSFINDIIAEDDIMQFNTLSITNPDEVIALLLMNDKKTLTNLASFILKNHLKKMGILDVVVKYDMTETDARTYFNVSFSFKDDTPQRNLRKFLNEEDIIESFTWIM